MQRALYFPAIGGTCLFDNKERNTADMLKGKVSLVCILTSVLSEQHAKSYYEAALELYGSGKDRNFQLVQINLQENRLKAYVVSLFASSLKKTIPVHLQSTYLLSHQDLTMEREDLALHNKHVGYTYLVGPDEKSRWGGAAFAEREERQALIACTGVLLSRLAEEKKKK
jgi:ATPase complex subunit ATP10